MEEINKEENEINNKMNNEVQELELTWEDIFRVASGMTLENESKCAACLALDEIKDNNIKKVKEIFFENAALNFHSIGGALTVTADFDFKKFGICASAKTLCESWLKEHKENERLTLTCVPYLLEGQIILLLDNLAFVDAYECKYDNKRMFRLILVFDNTSTVVATTDEINYKEIYEQVQFEIKRMEEDIDREIEEAMEEERKANQEINEIDMKFKQQLNNPLDLVENDNMRNAEDLDLESEEMKERVRFVEEEQNIR